MQSSPDTNFHEREEFEDSEDYTSSSGSSSDESSEAESDAEGKSTSGPERLNGSSDLRPAPFPLLMPSSTGKTGTVPSSGLNARLAQFLPSFKAANEALQTEQEREGSTAGNLEVGDDDDEPYVDMSLGLGVLEQVADESSEDSDDEASDVDQEREAASEDESPPRKRRKTGALEKLMGEKKGARPSIEVVDGEQPNEKPA